MTLFARHRYAFFEQVNLDHPAMKFVVEISDIETMFLDTVVYQGTTLTEKAVLDVKTHFKRKPSSIYIFTSCHPPSVKMGLSKEKPWESDEETPLNVWGSISDFKKRLMDRG